LQAFGGYLNQRKSLLKMGIQIFEYKNNPEIQKRLMQRYPKHETPPTFAIHAKTMIIDSKMAYIGTFNLDPRSINLNTEVGVIIDDEHVAKQVSSAIEQDMLPENSWDVTNENPNKHNSWIKRSRATFWRLMPIKPLL
jgi:putative cardiolipin synthase